MNVPITIVAGTLPTGATYNAQTYFNAIVARMTATVSGSNIILGQLGGTAPNAALPGNGAVPGLWWGVSVQPTGNSGIFYAWNADAAQYLPAPISCGQLINNAIITTDIQCGAVTANNILLTPDKSGTIALTSDITGSSPVNTYGGSGTLNIDCSLPGSHYSLLSANTTVSFINFSLGQYVHVWLENKNTAYTVTWSGPSWPGGTAPTQSTSSGTDNIRHIDHYLIWMFPSGGLGVLGQAVAQNFQIGVASGTAPTVSSTTGVNALITVVFNATLQGGSIPTGDFTVRKNGNAQTINAATANGFNVGVTMASNLTTTDTWTIQYAGSDIKSLPGAAAANFGPLTISVSQIGSAPHAGSGGGLNNRIQ